MSNVETRVRGHRPALDGVRALAIVVVMIYHATSHWPRGGFFSVDVFFVLSGYLIAGVLLSEHRRWGRIDLSAFYVRRGRRLLPGLVLAVLGIALICPHVLDDSARSTMRGDGLATIFYYANWWFIHQKDSYFSQFGDASPYRHMWTLSIEEQFYAVLPMLMIVLLWLTRGRLRRVATVLAGLALVSAVEMALLHHAGQNPARVYYGTDTRAQDLLLGSTLAVVMAMLRRSGRITLLTGRRATLLGGVALAVMVTLFFALDENSTLTYRGAFTVFVLATCALITSVEVNQAGPIAHVLGLRWWAWIGTISYGLYLWHWPVFVMLSADRVGFGGPALFVLRFAISFALGAASFHLVEDRIRRHGLRRWIGQVGGRVAGFGALPVAAMVVVLVAPNVQVLPSATAKTGESSAYGSYDPKARLRILIVGDSVGFAIGYAFPKATYPGVSVVGDVIFGCGTAGQHLVIAGKVQPDESKGQCKDVFGRWRSDVATYKPQVVLWSLGGWEVFDHRVGGRTLTATSAGYARYLRSRLEQGLAQLGSSVQVVIPNVPCYHQPSYAPNGVDMAPDRNDPRRAAAVNRVLVGFAAAHRNVHVVDVASKVCPGGRFTERIDGVQIRQDGVHYTLQGVPYFWRWVMPAIRAVVKE